jgi:hypothetical protein
MTDAGRPTTTSTSLKSSQWRKNLSPFLKESGPLCIVSGDAGPFFFFAVDAVCFFCQCAGGSKTYISSLPTRFFFPAFALKKTGSPILVNRIILQSPTD